MAMLTSRRFEDKLSHGCEKVHQLGAKIDEKDTQWNLRTW